MQTILGYCSQLVGLGFDGGDLNTELAERCVAANKNVLRLISGGRPWDMCQNIGMQARELHERYHCSGAQHEALLPTLPVLLTV